MSLEKKLEKEAEYKVRGKKIPGKEFQEREVQKLLRRKITESDTLSAFLKDEYFHPKIWVKRQQTQHSTRG